MWLNILAPGGFDAFVKPKPQSPENGDAEFGGERGRKFISEAHPGIPPGVPNWLWLWYGDPALEGGSKSKKDGSLELIPRLGRRPICFSVCCGSTVRALVEPLPNALKNVLFFGTPRVRGAVNVVAGPYKPGGEPNA